MIYKGYEILAEIDTVGVWAIEDDGRPCKWLEDARNAGNPKYFSDFNGSRVYTAELNMIRHVIDLVVAGWKADLTFEFVQNLSDTQGVGIVSQEHTIEEGGLEFCQFYGHRTLCDDFSNDKCSHDGSLWGPSGRIVVFCTTHAFPQEQLGYEFYAVEVAA